MKKVIVLLVFVILGCCVYYFVDNQNDKVVRKYAYDVTNRYLVNHKVNDQVNGLYYLLKNDMVYNKYSSVTSYETNEECIKGMNYNNQVYPGITYNCEYRDTLLTVNNGSLYSDHTQLNKKYFLGFDMDAKEKVLDIYVCGYKNDELFCLSPHKEVDEILNKVCESNIVVDEYGKSCTYDDEYSITVDLSNKISIVKNGNGLCEATLESGHCYVK